jgi:hypothetical protein
MLDTDEVTTVVVPNLQIGLIELAALLTPEAQGLLGYYSHVDLDTDDCGVELKVSCYNKDDFRNLRKAFGGGKWMKTYTDWDYTEARTVSPNLTITLNSSRGAVCERVQVGTRQVVKPDPDALKELQKSVKQVTVDEPIYEWDCGPQKGA